MASGMWTPYHWVKRIHGPDALHCICRVLLLQNLDIKGVANLVLMMTMQAYDGKVRKDLDHDKLMPAAWRLEKYLDADGDGDDDLSLDALRAHTLVYNMARPGDDMARTDNVDDLVVSHRLLIRFCTGLTSYAHSSEPHQCIALAMKLHTLDT